MVRRFTGFVWRRVDVLWGYLLVGSTLYMVFQNCRSRVPIVEQKQQNDATTALKDLSGSWLGFGSQLGFSCKFFPRGSIWIYIFWWHLKCLSVFALMGTDVKWKLVRRFIVFLFEPNRSVSNCFLHRSTLFEVLLASDRRYIGVVRVGLTNQKKKLYIYIYIYVYIVIYL